MSGRPWPWVVTQTKAKCPHVGKEVYSKWFDEITCSLSTKESWFSAFTTSLCVVIMSQSPDMLCCKATVAATSSFPCDITIACWSSSTSLWSALPFCWGNNDEFVTNNRKTLFWTEKQWTATKRHQWHGRRIGEAGGTCPHGFWNLIICY